MPPGEEVKTEEQKPADQDNMDQYLDQTFMDEMGDDFSDVKVEDTPIARDAGTEDLDSLELKPEDFEDKPQEDVEPEAEPDVESKGKRGKDKAAESLRTAYEETKKKVEEFEALKTQWEEERSALQKAREDAEKRFNEKFGDQLKVDPNEVPEVKESLNKYVSIENSFIRLYPNVDRSTFRRLVGEFGKLDPSSENYREEFGKIEAKISDLDPRLNGREDVVLRTLAEASDQLTDYSQKYTSASSNTDEARYKFMIDKYNRDLASWNEMKSSVFEVPAEKRTSPDHWSNILDSFRKMDAFKDVEKRIMDNLDALFVPQPPVQRSKFKSDEEYFNHLEKIQSINSKRLEHVPSLVARALALGPILSLTWRQLQKYKSKVSKELDKDVNFEPNRDKPVVKDEELGMSYNKETGELILPDADELTRSIMP